MKLSGMGKLLTILYDDRMDIYRTGSSENADSTTSVTYSDKPVLKDVPCRISFSSDDTGSDSEVDMNPIRYNPKLFCAPGVDIRAGDYVVVTRVSDSTKVEAQYFGMIAQPSWYSTHQEAFMRIDEGA